MTNHFTFVPRKVNTEVLNSETIFVSLLLVFIFIGYLCVQVILFILMHAVTRWTIINLYCGSLFWKVYLLCSFSQMYGMMRRKENVIVCFFHSQFIIWIYYALINKELFSFNISRLWYTSTLLNHHFSLFFYLFK